MVRPVSNLTPFTLLDYPDKTACILWYAGCNMRCLYCYNPEVVLGKGKFSLDQMLVFLKSRVGLLDAVVFSGGECLLHKDIESHIKTVKEMGFLVKVDTNGSQPKKLQKLLEAQLIDYVALDFKSKRESFEFITQSDLFDKFEASLKMLIAGNYSFEVRTTYHSELIAKQEMYDMIDYLKFNQYSGVYYLQHFRNNSPTLTALNNSQNNLDAFRDQNLQISVR
ncbi:anaerobic ribonucleoside-triphosphate reductase activating protein [Flavobacterium sp. CYK-55]|uniref:anaerobic ribonucleoside-triphosphate reductase activating protein n=1 Tax=Flavobacterium sp. CYK-55 TaxID=2835529 RepID=UPI001BCC081A|nr:anaerobic ribonucleoside-triphosphate reductase activating protein [Flavobacterium sp. CYK-55]MBS7786597.1 anaerobic ribonucleoside-triphosphate reductase activating protein [Flavobacterium sp. CYK-55]